MNFQRYNKIVFFLSVWLIPLFLLCLYMEPIDSELTRMGGYLENDYGWNAPQEQFLQPLFKKALTVSDYEQYYDVLVFGDSFSENESYGWQNYLANESGLTIISFNMNLVELDEILNSPIYKANPPKLFIYESVERNILSRHSRCVLKSIFLGDAAVANTINPPDIELLPLGATVSKKLRYRTFYSIDGLNFSATINYVKKSLSRNLLNINITEVHKYPLSRTGLFSNRANDSLLILTRDFNIKDTTEQQIKTAQCSLLTLQKRIRKKNKTAFIAVVFPDKTSVYSKFIQDKTYSDFSIAGKIEQTPNLNIVHVVADFRNAIENGVVDFYLPNDSHCGFTGYKMTAKKIVEMLKHPA